MKKSRPVRATALDQAHASSAGLNSWFATQKKRQRQRGVKIGRAGAKARAAQGGYSKTPVTIRKF